MDIHDMKMIWWNWFCCSPQYWGHGLTLKKLRKLYVRVFDDKNIWFDLFERHNLKYTMPWNINSKKRDIDNYENYTHAIGNFAGNVYELAVLNKLVKV